MIDIPRGKRFHINLNILVRFIVWFGQYVSYVATWNRTCQIWYFVYTYSVLSVQRWKHDTCGSVIIIDTLWCTIFDIQMHELSCVDIQSHTMITSRSVKRWTHGFRRTIVNCGGLPEGLKRGFKISQQWMASHGVLHISGTDIYIYIYRIFKNMSWLMFVTKCMKQASMSFWHNLES